MSAILTSEEKKYLRRICRYLGSLGMREGTIELDLDDSSLDCENVMFERFTHFSNNYHAEIPIGLTDILKKIFQHICDRDLINTPDVDSVNYERIELTIHCDEGEISVSHYYSYYETSEAEGSTHYLSENPDDDSLKQVFESLSSEGISSKNGRPLHVDYNGSGDSGYIEDQFTNGQDVPAAVQDYCYRMLEDQFGGWEINEGSQGYFEIDTIQQYVELTHYANVEESSSDTVWEETF